tara:strand:+ start:1233 stop:1739 length:507 start_codon:yes stop_codon:yes gene_type:complete
MLKLILIAQKVLFTILIGTILSSCNSKKENFDIDISNFKPTKTIKKADESNKTTLDFENNLYIKDLVPSKNKEQILSNTKFGKKDPFSKDDIQINQLNSDLKLTGFLSTEINKYAMVKYLNNVGTLTEESEGGLNTNLLPKGAKVIKIDPKNKILIITFDNNNFIFEL